MFVCMCCSLNEFQVKMISNWFDPYFLLFKDYGNKSGTKEIRIKLV